MDRQAALGARSGGLRGEREARRLARGTRSPIEEEAGAARPPQEEALLLTQARTRALPCPSLVA